MSVLTLMSMLITQFFNIIEHVQKSENCLLGIPVEIRIMESHMEKCVKNNFLKI